MTEVEPGTVVFVCTDNVNLNDEKRNTTKGNTKGLLFANEAVFV